MNPPVNLSQVKVVSWDIDGTMYDLDTLISAFKRDLFRRMLSRGWIRAWRDFFRLLRFKRFMDRIRKAAGDYRVPPVPDRDIIAQTQDEMYARILPEIGPCDGVIGLMKWLQAHDIKQVAFSDYRPSTKLTALGVNHFFDAIYAGEDLGFLKPAPPAFQAILDAHDLSPPELLHIGDRADTDGGATAEVGYQVALIGPQYDSASELLETLRAQADTT